MVTVIYSIRDRDPERLRNSIKSLRKNTVEEISFVVVDYGSSAYYAGKIYCICKDEGAQYVRAESQGLPWSRSHALNIGVMNSNFKVVYLFQVF